MPPTLAVKADAAAAAMKAKSSECSSPGRMTSLLVDLRTEKDEEEEVHVGRVVIRP